MAIKGEKTWLVYGGLSVGSLAAGFPFAWMILVSFMTRGESMRRVLLPQQLEWDNYLKAWREADFGLYFENSLIIAVLQVGGTLLFSLLAAYPFELGCSRRCG